MDKICLFDVNGTLSDLGGLDATFADIFGKAGERELWFKTVLHTSLALTVAGDYQPFATIIERTLLARAEAKGVRISDKQQQDFKARLRHLPPHPDVVAGMEVLKGAGYRIAALTNSSVSSARAQLSHVGIESYFDAVLSTDSVRAAKPAPQPYLFAAKHFKVAPQDLWLMAAHAWDTHGAARAGLKSALILRPEHGLNQCFAQPDVQGADLIATAHALVAKDRPLLDKVLHQGGAG